MVYIRMRIENLNLDYKLK